MNFFLTIIFVVAVYLNSTATAKAVPPPDFIFNIGSQIVQIFTFIVLGFSVVIGTLRRFFQAHPLFQKYGKLMWVLLSIAIVLIALGGAYYYDKYNQQKAYTKWVEESKQQATAPEEETLTDNLDQLKVGELKGNVMPRGEAVKDKGVEFIESYYYNLDVGDTSAAYAVSSKTVPYEAYKDWYKDTSSVKVDSIQKISDNYYSLGLTLKDAAGVTRYAVLTKLKNSGSGGFNIESSDVRVLAQTDEQTSVPLAENTSPKQGSDFYGQFQNLGLSISNEDFQNITNSQNDAYILDAREDEEYEIGRFPGSHHIRFADLKSGEWIKLPQNKIIYVLCWSGIRGKEVAEFLRTKNIVARYLDKGADGWVTFGGKWDGGIKFLSEYTEQRYQIVFTTDEVKKYIQQGIVIVDSRHPTKFQNHHIPNSISIPIIYTPTSKMEAALSQVPPNSTVITVCDDFVSCFDAKVTGVKLEKRGNIFLGRYNKPWEYTQ